MTHKLRIVAILDKGANIDKFEKLLSKSVLNFEFIKIQSDFSKTRFIPSGYRMVVDPQELRLIGKTIFAQYGYDVDFIMCFFNTENWMNGDIKFGGHHYGEVFSTYETSSTKLKGIWSRVAYHELMHKFDDFIFRELGVRLEDVFKVRDFDRDIVHAEDPKFGREYDYNDTVEAIAPLISNAIESRRARGTLYRSLVKKLTDLYRELALLQRKQEEMIPEILEEPMNTTPPEPIEYSPIIKWATAMKEHEGWCVAGQRLNGVLYPEGSRSYRNNNPGNLRISKFQAGQRDGYAYFNTYLDGWEALLFQLRLVGEGKSPVYNAGAQKQGLKDSSELNLLQFFHIYAPTSDNNSPETYAKVVAGKIGVPVTTKVRELV